MTKSDDLVGQPDNTRDSGMSTSCRSFNALTIPARDVHRVPKFYGDKITYLNGRCLCTVFRP